MSLSKVSKLKASHKANTKKSISKHTPHQLDSLTKSVANFLDEHQLIKNHLKPSGDHESLVHQLAKLIVHLIINEHLLKEKIKNSKESLYTILHNAIEKGKKTSSSSKTKKKTVVKKKTKAKTINPKAVKKKATVSNVKAKVSIKKKSPLVSKKNSSKFKSMHSHKIKLHKTA
ncbi:MAG: hypothetical protein AB8U25_05220 [Rickettsiales endosymbiont of Dermacentor nuttalli]